MWGGATDVAQPLLDAGADVNAADTEGGRPLHLAARKGHAAMVQLLLAAGAEVEAVSREGEERRCGLQRQAGHVEVMRVLLAAGAAVDRASRLGITPLMAAAQNGQLSVLHALLDAGASLEAADRHAFTALTCAAGGGHGPCVAALLAAGAAVDRAGGDTTPLTPAAANHHPAAVARLLAAGAAFAPGIVRGLQRALLPVWEGAPARLPDLAQHMEPGVLARVRTALAALRLRTPAAPARAVHARGGAGVPVMRQRAGARGGGGEAGVDSDAQGDAIASSGWCTSKVQVQGLL